MKFRAVVASATVAVPLAILAAAPSGRAVIKDAQGTEVGTASLTSADAGVKVEIKVSNLSPGQHGIHIHEMGKCEAPEFKSAGGHFNPQKKKHGSQNPEGAHAGDLENLTVGNDGKATATFIAKKATLGDGDGSLFGANGTAIVIHADPDDLKTDPAGKSGARIACGVIEKK